MLFVWVRTVLSANDQLVRDAWAIKVRGEEPKDIKLPLAERLDQALVHRGGPTAASEGTEQASNVLRCDAAFAAACQHRRHRRALAQRTTRT